MSAVVHVAVGIVTNHRAEVLIARRPDHVHQGGLWEFPGGKLEAGESVRNALARELREELGIRVIAARPLIRVHHEYADKRVLLDVWRVSDYHGYPRGLQEQPLAWVAPAELLGLSFPAADMPIITALRLPDCYLITGEPAAQSGLFLERFRAALDRGCKLAQLRAKSLPEAELFSLYSRVRSLAREYDVPVLLNGSPEQALSVDADGVHLSTAQLLRLQRRPLAAERWVAASCHNEAEVLHARRVGVDFIVISPVKATPSHPGLQPMGWERLRVLAEMAGMPVYALGGMSCSDLDTAWQHGVQGIAAIRALWQAE